MEEQMKTVYCQMLGDGIPTELCGSEQGQRGCKNCKASTRKCEKCKLNAVTRFQDGLCEGCAVPVRVEIPPTMSQPEVRESIPTVHAEQVEQEEYPEPLMSVRETLLEKIEGLRRVPKKRQSSQRKSDDRVSATTYSAVDGVRFVIYLTPTEFAVWSWLLAHRQPEALDDELMLPPGPRGLRLHELQESIGATLEEYFLTLERFESAGLIATTKIVGDRLRFCRLRFSPRKFHVVRLPSRPQLRITPAQRELIDAVQADELDIPAFNEVAAALKEWIAERFPSLDPVRARAKLVGLVRSYALQSWGILYLHGRSERCLVCRKGFEAYEFVVAPSAEVPPEPVV